MSIELLEEKIAMLTIQIKNQIYSRIRGKDEGVRNYYLIVKFENREIGRKINHRYYGTKNESRDDHKIGALNIRTKEINRIICNKNRRFGRKLRQVVYVNTRKIKTYRKFRIGNQKSQNFD